MSGALILVGVVVVLVFAVAYGTYGRMRHTRAGIAEREMRSGTRTGVERAAGGGLPTDRHRFDQRGAR